MKLFKLFIALAVVGLITTSCSDEQMDIPIDESTLRSNGNGAPNGPHYNLNIIGVSNNLTADMTGNNGHRIFVKLSGKTKIKLKEGDDFQVLDANGTDNDGASFQLPNPDPDGDGVTDYSIWMRALGKPGGSAIISLCADGDLTEDYYEVCTADPLEVESGNGNGPPKFRDVSKKLLTILVLEDITFEDGDGVEQTISAGRYGIFDETFEDYFWSY
ncbi:MAG: hypothetical protein KJO25_00240, partial [Bacteroidia bacterium]|nr:hypothetical protein [Bacteroidia bacterium]